MDDLVGQPVRRLVVESGLGADAVDDAEAFAGITCDWSDSSRPAATPGLILVDTSAWVEYDRATGSSADLRLTALIAQTAEVAVTEPVIMEVASGARSVQREWHLRRLLSR